MIATSPNTKAIDLDAAELLFMNYCRSKNLSPNTIVWYRFRLSAMKTYFGSNPDLTVDQITLHDIRGLIAHLIKINAPKTVNHTVVALKKFFSFLAEEEIIEKSPAAKLEKVKAPRVLITAFSDDQVSTLLAQPDRARFSGFRDYALMLLLLDSGLRINEALNLKLGDINWDNNTVKVMGKGSLERIVPFGRNVAKNLDQYLERRGVLDNDWVFVNELGTRLATRTIEDNMREYGIRGEIIGVRVSPHTCRHFAAISYLRNGGSVFHLQKLLGHSSLDICRTYLNLANDDMEKAHLAYSPLDNMLVSARPTEPKQRRKRLR